MTDAVRHDSRLVSGPELARTYAHPAYADPWKAVEEYRAVMDYAGNNPDAGSTAVANRFELPRSRVRPWLDGSRPDCVRGLQTAEAHGWVDVAPDSDVFRGLNVMLAWIFSGGSILNETWMPYWVADDELDRDLLERAAALVGVELDWTRSADDGRARELRPIEDASVLGRVLVVLGAPRGEKNEANDVTLPSYLETEPVRVGQEFVQVYFRNRGRTLDGEDLLRLPETRSGRYVQSLVALVRRLTGELVSASGTDVRPSPAAARAVRTWQPVLESEDG